MTMLRRLLSLLLVVPLLLPQGVCVCDFMQKSEACSECNVRVEPAKPTCGCRKHRQAAAGAQEQTTIVRGHRCHQSVPADQRNDHAPGCPAKTGGAAWKIETAQTSIAVDSHFLGLV